MQKILILGVSGMLGNALFRFLSSQPELSVGGTVRSATVLKHFQESLQKNVISEIDVENNDALIKLFAEVKPSVVINCVGVVKQLSSASEVLTTLPINSLLPHRLSYLCKIISARLIHISTDCVFNGKRGNYTEEDDSDAQDVYGKSKFLGEVNDSHAITLRTSIIGRELITHHGLVNWFLKQEGPVKGFTRAIFSGLPTIELANIIHQYVLTNTALSGVYHVASSPISKYELLRLIALRYNKSIELIEDDHLIIDRSLNADKFNQATGYQPPTWPELVKRMYEFK